MSLSNFSIVTSAGLDFCLSAYNAGPLIAIKYFLPVWDYRIDPYIHDGSETSVIALSASIASTDTIPTGEKFWNISTDNAYTLSNTDDFIISASGETLDETGNPWILTDSVMSKEQKINLYNGVPLSNYISGSDVDASATSNAWEIYDGVLVIGNNDVPSETSAGTNRYYQVTDYYPVSDGGVLKGSFKCRLNKKIGTIKFNKIGLYVVQVDNNGVETSSPTLFAEAVIDAPITKSNYGTSGFEDIVIDVQIQIGSITTNFSDVFYSTSADYWSRTVGGVYYSENVGIGIFDDGYEEMQNKLHIKESDATKPQLRLDYGLGTSATTSATFHTTSGGNLEITLSSNKAIQPKTTNSIDLGTSALDFRNIYSTSANFDYLDDSGAGLIKINKNLIPVTHNTINFGSTDVRWENGFFNILESSAAYTDYICPNTNAVSYSSLGSSSRVWKYLFIDTISNYTNEVKLTENLIPLTDERCSIGNSSHVFSAGYFDDIYIAKKSYAAGKWYNAGTAINNIFLSQPTLITDNWMWVPSGFMKRPGWYEIFNKALWTKVVLSGFQFSVFGNTIRIKFLLIFTYKGSGFTSAKKVQLCRGFVENRSGYTSTYSDLFNSIIPGAIHSSYDYIYTFPISQATTVPIFVTVKYKRDLIGDGIAGFDIDLIKHTTTSWSTSETEFTVPIDLTYEIE